MSNTLSNFQKVTGLLTHAYPHKDLSQFVSDSASQKLVNKCMKIIKKPLLKFKLNKAEKVISELSVLYSIFDDDDLLKIAADIRRESQGKTINFTNKTKAIALVQELALRHMKLSYTKDQLTAAWVMLNSGVASVDREVGKTITVGLAAVVGAIFAKPVHVYSFDEASAQALQDHFQPLCHVLGIATFSQNDLLGIDKKWDFHSCSIVFGTLREFVSDYLVDMKNLGNNGGFLRQKMALFCREGAGFHLRLSGLQYAFIDDADVLLSDEASRSITLFGKRNYTDEELFAYEALLIAKRLVPDQDFILNKFENRIDLTKEGTDHLRSLAFERGGLWYAQERGSQAVVRALCVQYLYRIEEHYLINGNIVIPLDPTLKSDLEGDTITPKLKLLLRIKEDRGVSASRHVIDRTFGKKVLASYLHLGGIENSAPELTDEFEQSYDVSVLNVGPFRRQLSSEIDTVVYQNTSDWARKITIRAEALVAQKKNVLIVTRSEKLTHVLEETLLLFGLPYQKKALSPTADPEEMAHNQPEKIQIIPGLFEKDPRLSPENLGNKEVVIIAECQASMRIERQIEYDVGHQIQTEKHLSWDDPILYGQWDRGLFHFVRICAGLFPKGAQLLGKLILVWGMRKQERYLSNLRQSVGKHDLFIKRTFSFTERVK
ncbi:hypothetical protein [Kiloniella sp.]|uniref:hypothetical protein n=1 Tax=Kiloniella sp. TaxID=1938587 RepID=UPI003B013C77